MLIAQQLLNTILPKLLRRDVGNVISVAEYMLCHLPLPLSCLSDWLWVWLLCGIDRSGRHLSLCQKAHERQEAKRQSGQKTDLI